MRFMSSPRTEKLPGDYARNQSLLRGRELMRSRVAAIGSSPMIAAATATLRPG